MPAHAFCGCSDNSTQGRLEQQSGDCRVGRTAVGDRNRDDGADLLGGDVARLVAAGDAQRVAGHGAARVRPAGDPGEEARGGDGLGDAGGRQAIGGEDGDVFGQRRVGERPAGERCLEADEGGGWPALRTG